MNKPISVIVPTRHRDDMLALCLDRLAPGAQTLPFTEYDVTVTDNGQTATAEKMMRERYPWARWTKGPGGGPADNRNSGVSHATGAWIAFTDDDCLPEADWLESYVRARDSAGPGVRAMEGAILAADTMSDQMADCPVNLNGNSFWTANVFIERRLFDEVKGFDTSFPGVGGEDYELYLRLQTKTKVLWVPDARVFHPVRLLTVPEAIKMAEVRNLVWAHCIHLHPNIMRSGNGAPSAIAWYMFKSQLVDAKEKLVRGQFRRAYSILAALPRATADIRRHLKGLQRLAA